MLGCSSHRIKTKGFSLTEILVAVGIMGVLSGIAGIAYMDYLNKGRLTALEESARNFWTAAEVCAITRGEDLTRCNTKAKLRFNCDDCSAVSYYPGRTTAPLVHPRLGIVIKSGDCSMCVHYSPTASAVSSWHSKQTTIKCYDWKFCTFSKNFTNDWKWDSTTKTWSKTGVPKTGTGYGVRKPFERCSANSDCKTGEVCHSFPKGDFAVGGRGPVCN